MRSFIRTLAMTAMVVVAPALSAQAKKAETKPAAAVAKTAPKAEAPAAAGKIDINTSTAAELEAFPGIGKALAAKIIKGRPYANKLQLVQKKILTQAVYDKIKDNLIAKQ